MVDLRPDRPDGFNKGQNLEIGRKMGGDDFFRDRGRGDTAYRLTGTRASPALPVADAVFGLVGVVSVGRAELFAHLRVGLGTVILVADENRDGTSEGEALEGAGEDLGFVLLVARRRNLALPGTAPVEIDLDVGLGQGDERRAAIHDDSHSATMGFSPGGYLK